MGFISLNVDLHNKMHLIYPRNLIQDVHKMPSFKECQLTSVKESYEI